MKKVIILIISILTIFIITGCEKNKIEIREDAIKFKQEYESLNNQTNKSGKVIRSVSIEKTNPFIYKTEDELVTMIENKESFIVYFGFATCPWCRSMITNLVEASKKTNTKDIYYVDVLNIRDTKVFENGEIKTSKDGTTGYMKLLDLIGNVLSKYKIEDDNGNVIDTKEKRIYAPNIVVIKEGNAIYLTEGVSSNLKDPYGQLTEDMVKESYDMIEEALKKLNNNVCTDKC